MSGALVLRIDALELAGEIDGDDRGLGAGVIVLHDLSGTVEGLEEYGGEKDPHSGAIGDVEEAGSELELGRLFDERGRGVSHAPTDARFALNGELIQISFNCRLNDLAPGNPCSGAERMIAPVRSPFPMET
jgi:hypothetical protein